MKWITKKNNFFFKKIKDKCLHPACWIYHSVCSGGETYVEETVRNLESR